MLKINLVEDEELSGVINNFISALLPHQNFDSSAYTNILATIFKYVKLEEFQLEYRLILEALSELGRIKLSMLDFEPKLTRDVFESILEASIMDAVVRPELGVVEWLNYEGLKSDLTIPTNKEDACQKLCARALSLYDDCFEIQESSTDILNHEPELRAAFMSHMGVQCINFQSEIMRHKARVGKAWYQGYEDWLKYTKRMTVEISERLESADSERIVQLDSVEGSYKLLQKIQSLLVPIADWGIPELDDITPILRHRLVVVVGNENIGKTKFAVDESVNVLLTGGKVVYMCGETEKAKVFADLMVNYIYKKYQIIIRPVHLASPESCPDDVRKIIGMSIEEVVSNGGLTLCDAFNYGTLREELDKLYEKVNFDMVVIDHSCALVGSTGDGTLKSKIDKLAFDCRDFKKSNPVCVLVTSHPSIASKETAKKDKTTEDSPTKGSQNLSTEADEVFYLRDNDILRKQNLIMLENTKRRDGGRLTEPVVLQKKFEVSAFIYNAELQSGNTRVGIERAEALNDLEKRLGVNNEEDDDLFNLEG